MTTLLGTHVHFYLNRVAAARCIKSLGNTSTALVNVHLEHQNEEKRLISFSFHTTVSRVHTQ